MIDTVPITAEPPSSNNPGNKTFEVYDLSFDEVCEITDVMNSTVILIVSSTFQAIDQQLNDAYRISLLSELPIEANIL